jgi:hypothetical protein
LRLEYPQRRYRRSRVKIPTIDSDQSNIKTENEIIGYSPAPTLMNDDEFVTALDNPIEPPSKFPHLSSLRKSISETNAATKTKANEVTNSFTISNIKANFSTWFPRGNFHPLFIENWKRKMCDPLVFVMWQ